MSHPRHVDPLQNGLTAGHQQRQHPRRARTPGGARSSAHRV